MPKSVFKNDKYKRSRGGYSRFLQIFCEECGSLVCLYQKDGPGNLRRMYIDRISDPKVSLSKKDITCSKGHLLGVKIVYKKEKRPAFRLFVDSITKKIMRSETAKLLQ